MRAQQTVQGIQHQAERELAANTEAVQERAQQWVNDTVRPLQQQINLGNQQLADRDNQIAEREMRIARLQHKLMSLQHQQAHNIAVASPVPDSPRTVQTEVDQGNPFAHSPFIDPATPINTPPRQPIGMSPRDLPMIQEVPVVPNAAQTASSSQNVSSAPSIPMSFGPPVPSEPPGLVDTSIVP